MVQAVQMMASGMYGAPSSMVQGSGPQSINAIRYTLCLTAWQARWSLCGQEAALCRMANLWAGLLVLHAATAMFQEVFSEIPELCSAAVGSQLHDHIDVLDGAPGWVRMAAILLTWLHDWTVL